MLRDPALITTFPIKRFLNLKRFKNKAKSIDALDILS